MRTPKVNLPAEDPATKAAREREQARAESARTEETQALLLGDTVRRLRRFGRAGGSGGSVPIYGSQPSRPAASGGGGFYSSFALMTGGTKEQASRLQSAFDAPNSPVLY